MPTPANALLAPRPPLTFPRRRTLLLALLASLLLHLALTQWPLDLSRDDEAQAPLAVAITELPPPPAPVAAPAATAKPRRAPVVATRQVPSATVVAEPDLRQPEQPQLNPSPELPESAGLPVADVPAPSTEPALPAKALPPRVDLAYRAFLGSNGFLIGEAIYRLDHSARDYTISTVAEARGLAALFFHGQGRATSSGTITANGLQPDNFTIARTGTSNDRSESARFDWDAGTVLLKDDKLEAVELPTFDPLIVLWQFYFAPPAQDAMEFAIATTRKIYHYAFRRAGSETVELPWGNVEAQVWKRESGDGALDAEVWLAPSLHFVAVKVRLSNNRATVELLLNGIRVDDTVAQR
jgi:hypothetical protein